MELGGFGGEIGLVEIVVGIVGGRGGIGDKDRK